jgi:uncharacterized protein (DUF1330 family)
MTAYCIVRVNVTDPDKYEDYKRLTPAAVAAFGGKFIVRGGAAETVEGPEETRRIVLVEFPDMEQAKACFDSPQYAEAKEKRIGAAEMEMIVVDGV